MEIEIENKNKNKERRGPDSKPNMRYFKIHICQNFVWKVGDYSGPKGEC